MFVILYNTDLFASSSINQNFCIKCKKLLCTWKPVSCLSETAYKREKRSNITEHTGLLLVTANEQPTAPGNTRVSLTMGTLGTSHWTVISQY